MTKLKNFFYSVNGQHGQKFSVRKVLIGDFDSVNRQLGQTKNSRKNPHSAILLQSTLSIFRHKKKGLFM